MNLEFSSNCYIALARSLQIHYQDNSTIGKSVLIHLSPAVSTVDDDGARRPARVDISDLSEERSRTGEEPSYEMDEDGIIGTGDLGLTKSRDEVKEIISNLDLANGELFEDPEFRCGPSALFYSQRSEEELSLYTWKRPFQLSPTGRPQLYIDGTSRRDVIQGILGDCWLLSTCAAIAKKEELLHRVIPPHQVLFGSGYTGLIEVRLWRYGTWVSVFIDDRLPQRKGNYCYAHCEDPNEFWVAMIEKAFAKLHGSYEAIEGGMPIEAMVDMTGGLAERYELKNAEKLEKLYRFLRRSFASQAFITCSRKGDWRGAHQADKNGLVQGHAYTITGIYRVELKKSHVNASSKKVHLIRVRNPWGDSNEWRGEWCDGHKFWDLVPHKTKRAMGLHNLYDGEFWMEFFHDFCREFEEVSICTLGPDFNHDGTVDQADTVRVIFGEWTIGKSAGGCRNNLRSFSKNPQFLLRVHEPDDVQLAVLDRHNPKNFISEEIHSLQRQESIEQNLIDPKSQVIICLAQDHRRTFRDKKVKLQQIGFCVYRTPPIADGVRHNPLDEQFFAYNYDVGNSGPYINYREVFARFELSPGDYVIIPATFSPDTPSKFMIRVYAGKSIDLSLIKH